jgi:hypothetical protein
MRVLVLPNRLLGAAELITFAESIERLPGNRCERASDGALRLDRGALVVESSAPEVLRMALLYAELLEEARWFASSVWDDCRLPGPLRRDLEASYHNGLRSALGRAEDLADSYVLPSGRLIPAT